MSKCLAQGMSGWTTGRTSLNQNSPGVELRPEEWYREQEKTELEALVDPSIKSDIGASQTGLYDLVGELPLFIFHHDWCTVTLVTV
jgi:hypothetical protein